MSLIPRRRRRDSSGIRASAPLLAHTTARTPGVEARVCATSDIDARGRADRPPDRGSAAASRDRPAGGGRAARARRGSPDRRSPVEPLAVVALHVVHQGVPPPLLEDVRALHERRLRLDEVLAPVAPDAWMDERVHADRVAGTGLDAHTAVDALERVDLVADRVL